MSVGWLEELLPSAMVSPRTKIWWVLFFALFPLAYAGGVWLEMVAESPARIVGAVDRAASIRKAEEFAASKGVSVAGWRRYAIAETRDNVLAYYGDAKQPELAAASTMAPAREVQVLFRSPDLKQEFRVYLSLTGQVTGYDFGKSSARERNVTSKVGVFSVQTKTKTTTSNSNDVQDVDQGARARLDQQAEAIARQAFAANTMLSNEVRLGEAKVSSNADDPLRRDVTWDASPARTKGLTLKITYSVRDSQIVAQHFEAGVDKEHVAKKSKLKIFLNVVYSFFVTFGAVYAIYRYAKRTLQKEVSHLRTLVMAGLFFVSYGTLAYSLAIDQIATRVGGETFAQIGIVVYVTSGICCLILGLLVGIAYSSGEGEVREAYPGKLTSLDALLAGRLFSRDVAASLLFGAAAAGWLLLCQHALSYFLTGDIVSTRSDVLTYTFARLPGLTLLLGRQYDSLLIAVAGLLLPASFLLRSGVHKKRRFAWLILFALCSVLLDAAKYPTPVTTLLAMAVLVSALLLPFFAFDLLAAMVSLSTLAYVNELARLSAVFPPWTGFALSLAVAAAVVLAMAAYVALHGRPVREEDVRPQYAKNLAERMGMQAEILAAREAQLRLLPQAAPEIPGIQLAACCLPARGVGGDFYDFFRLDANRIGIFVAQGGQQGLASALCIALAKGVLMHASQQPHSPTQIVLELEASIAELLESGSGAGISFAYGVMDTRRNLLNYARVGSSPRLLVHREGSRLTTSAQLERLATIPGRLKSAPLLYEGATHVQGGDYLVFFTAGVTSLHTRRFAKREYQWLDILMREFGRQDEPLQAALVSALGKYQNQAADDLTAVVLRVVKSQAILQEVVA